MRSARRPVPSAVPGLALFALAMLAAGPAAAGTGYDIDYDYPGHGADWYGRSVREELKYDYPAEPIDLFLSGDDFGAGYDPAFEHLGLGPSLEHTQLHHTEYEFRFNPGAVAPPPTTACSDGIDNDGDGFFDYPADPGCTSLDDTSEREPNGPVCDDTFDNDSDGLADFPDDPGCTSAFDTDERDALAPACDDGVDNDGDGLADYPDDPGCVSPFDTGEREPTAPACDDGADNDGDGTTDYPADPGCTGPFDDGERDASAPACDDGIDNDRDGFADFPDDPGCLGPFDGDETEEIPSLGIKGDLLFWTDIPAVVGYDVVHGDVVKLSASGGDFSAALLACLADDYADILLELREDPTPGRGFWFLVRAVFPRLNGTYDSGSPTQIAPRDPRIEASPASCP
ncbi:MAG: hypothetical protein V3U98_04680 [Acidobacteriota bacterium]